MTSRREQVALFVRRLKESSPEDHVLVHLREETDDSPRELEQVLGVRCSEAHFSQEEIALSLAVRAWWSRDVRSARGIGITETTDRSQWLIAIQSDSETQLLRGEWEAITNPERATDVHTAELPSSVRALWLGEADYARLTHRTGEPPRALLSGSFRPLHSAHRALAAAASDVLGCAVVFELPIANADKPPLDLLSLNHRARQFQSEELILTRAGTFVEKSRLFPDCTFVVGADTAVRVLDPRFYDDANRDAAFAEIAANGCRFLVAGRVANDQHFLTRDEIGIPRKFASLFEPLPGFRQDLSSTELRQGGLGWSDFAVL